LEKRRTRRSRLSPMPPKRRCCRRHQRQQSVRRKQQRYAWWNCLPCRRRPPRVRRYDHRKKNNSGTLRVTTIGKDTHPRSISVRVVVRNTRTRTRRRNRRRRRKYATNGIGFRIVRLVRNGKTLNATTMRRCTTTHPKNGNDHHRSSPLRIRILIRFDGICNKTRHTNARAKDTSTADIAGSSLVSIKGSNYRNEQSYELVVNPQNVFLYL